MAPVLWPKQYLVALIACHSFADGLAGTLCWILLLLLWGRRSRLDVVLGKKISHFVRKIDRASVESHGFDLMVVGAVQVDNVGDGQDVGECGIFFHKKMFEIACAQFDELNIHACAMDCWDWKGADYVHGPDFS